ncbi:YfbR-like 5'-deoxynucleotidase [Priestia filamentosa]|uniref:YfbR-like 5'-deoxynucleotidase n=1 Tax=Priestia filamentosa TaxID=1402861 RepID=UPI00397B37A2
MENGKFIKTIIHMQNVPRWDEYAPHYEDNAANHSFRCAAYATIACLVEEIHYKNAVDKFKIIGRALFHDLNETITGSIKHITKKDPFVQEHIRVFEQEASKEIVSSLSKSLQATFYDYVVNAEDESFEGRLVDAIDTFDAMLFCHREMLYGSNPIFRKKFREFHEKLTAHDIQSVRWLVQEFDKREGVYEFLNNILMMDTIARWKGNFNLVKDNDSSHTFRATALSVFNGLLEKIKYGKTIDMYLLTGKTIFHDLVEAVTGDILGPVKHSNPKIKEAFELYEKKVASSMIESLPSFLRSEITELMVECKNNTYEGQMVDISDKLDALMKASLEMKNNQSEYAETYYRQLKKIQHKFTNESVVFFLAYILHDITHSSY